MSLSSGIEFSGFWKFKTNRVTVSKLGSILKFKIKEKSQAHLNQFAVLKRTRQTFGEFEKYK